MSRRLRERLALWICPWLQRPVPPPQNGTIVFDHVNGKAWVTTAANGFWRATG